MNNLLTTTPGDPALFEPLTTDENTILWAHLASGWYKQAAVYPGLDEPWQETRGLLNDLVEAQQASRQAEREPEAGQ